MAQLFDRLKQRKLGQWALAYMAGAWLVLQLVDVLGARWGVSDGLGRTIDVALVVGFGLTLVLAWYHGEQGRQRVSGPELLIIAGVLGLGALGLAFIGQGEGTTDAAGIAPIQRDKPAIAVLPFENLSADPENAFFAAGMHEEIISQLAKISSIVVISKSSVMGYATDRPPLREIAAALGVDFVLDGSARRAEERVRLTTQLIDGQTDEHLWAENYDRNLSVDDLFDIQDDVAGQVARSLSAAILPEEEERLGAQPTNDLNAYDFYLRGNQHFARGTILAETRMAVDMYEQATTLDPAFALAHAGLARNRVWMSWNWGLSGEYELAEAAIDRAVALAPDAPEVRVARAYLHYYGSRNYDRALEDFAFALQQEPGNVEALFGMGAVYRRLGRWEESLASQAEATRRNPRGLRSQYNMGQTAGEFGQYALAERHLSEAIAIAPNSYTAWRERAWLRVRVAGSTPEGWAVIADAVERGVGMYPERFSLSLLDRDFDRAGEAVAEWLAQDLVSLQARAAAAELAYHAGRMDEARRWADSARVRLEPRIAAWPEGLARDAYWDHGLLGLMHAILGNRDLALEHGEEAVRLLPLEIDAHNGPSMLVALAGIHAVLGQHDRALDQLERVAANPRRLNVRPFHLDPMWDPLKDDPRFAALAGG